MTTSNSPTDKDRPQTLPLRSDYTPAPRVETTPKFIGYAQAQRLIDMNGYRFRRNIREGEPTVFIEVHCFQLGTSFTVAQVDGATNGTSGSWEDWICRNCDDGSITVITRGALKTSYSEVYAGPPNPPTCRNPLYSRPVEE